MNNINRSGIIIINIVIFKSVGKVTLSFMSIYYESLTYRVEEFCEFGEVIPPASVYHLDVGQFYVVRLDDKGKKFHFSVLLYKNNVS
jgi:hypothetical protein